MSESLKSWLFAHTATQATLALESNYDLHDMPFLPGNRIQLLRFLTFRPFPSPNTLHTDVWALVGDRTHCIAARFARDQVNRFHLDHPLSFTSLKGALMTLTNVRVTVARVQVESGTCAYRHGQWAVVLDVRGWEVVGGVNEVVWYGGVKLVTSRNGVPEGEGERYEGLVRWMKKWVRYKAMMRRAREEQRRMKRQGEAGGEAGPSASTVLPTPGQRGQAVMGSSQVQNSQPPAPANVGEDKATQEESFPTTTMCSTQPPAAQPVDGTDPAPAMWTDFDLDADVDMANLDVIDQWNLSTTPPTDAATVTLPRAAAEAAQIATDVPSTQHPLQAPPPPTAESHQPSKQTQTQSNLDPDESGLSDYEREARRRKRQRGAPLPRSTTDDAPAATASCSTSTRQQQEPDDDKASEPAAVETPADAAVQAGASSSSVHPEPEQPPTAPVEAPSPNRRPTRSQLDHALMRELDRQRRAGAARPRGDTRAVSKDTLPTSTKKASSRHQVTATAPDAASSTKRRRQAALAAL